MRCPKGYSLIELLVASAISITLFAGILKLYLHLFTGYQYQQAVARIHEDARFALHILEEEIRETGYIGCAQFNSDFPFVNYTDWEWNHKTSIHGDVFADQKEAVTLQKASSDAVPLLKGEDHTVVVQGSSRIQPQDAFLVRDCSKSEVAIAQAVVQSNGYQRIELSRPLRFNYGIDAHVSSLESKTFYVGDTKRRSASGDSIFALYVKDNRRGHPQTYELVENIEQMQMYYGILQGSKTTYYPAQAIRDWQAVKSVHIVLMVGDHKLHQRWDDFVTLRNRG